MNLRFVVNFRRLLVAAVLLPITMNAGTTGLPWETPMGKISRSFAGPVMLAAGVALIAMVAIQHAHHGEFSDVSRRFGPMVIWLAGGFGAISLVTGLFLISGAVV